DDFCPDLHIAATYVREKELLVVIMDANACTGRRCDSRVGEDKAGGANELDKLNDNGEWLTRFVDDNRLALENTFFRTLKGQGANTYQGPKGASGWYRLYYLMVRQLDRHLVLTVPFTKT
ncbi:unnamed protein product, partial [Discosporangium mesarthrocarpum]